MRTVAVSEMNVFVRKIVKERKKERKKLRWIARGRERDMVSSMAMSQREVM